MHRFLFIFVLGIVGLAWLGGCGLASERPVYSTSQPITNGEIDNRPAHQAVVGLTNGGSMCSGTLVSPRVVLTAAHCADEPDPANYTIYFGTYMATGIEREVAEVLVNPDYDDGGDALPPVNDLALLLLSEPTPPGVSPIPNLPSYLGLSDSDIGRPLEYVGFGETETGDKGVRMSVENDLSWICVDPGGCSIGPALATYNTICQDQRPGGPCSGDSGGPSLIVRGGFEYVAGVTSYGDEDCTRFGCSMKADAFDSWIDEFKAGKLGAECSADDRCDSGICASGVCCAEACPDGCSTCAMPGFVGLCMPVPDGSDCSDGDACTGQEICQGGVCQGGQALDCNDGDPCTDDVCQANSGCSNHPLAEGSRCIAGDLCVGQAFCRSGSCILDDPLVCDDQDPCTEDSCDGQLGCIYEAVADGTACAGGQCGPAECQDGACQLLDPPDCDDGNMCTETFCDPRIGCMAQQVQDGMSCGKCRICMGFECVAEPGCKTGGCACGAAGSASGLGWIVWAAGLLGLVRRKYKSGAAKLRHCSGGKERLH